MSINTLFVKALTTHLEHIREASIRRKISQRERSRLLYDLETVLERLKKGEYEKANFSQNKFDIEDRNQQVFIDMQFYGLLGRTWSYLLDKLPISQYKEIADLCPGYTPKVELGLLYSGYTGRVVLIDKNEKALSRLEEFLTIINPRFYWEKMIVDITTKPKGNFSLVLANHFLDDFVIDYYARKFQIHTNSLYMEEKDFINLWKKILIKKTKHLNEVIDILTPSLSSLVKPSGTLCLVHYQSYAERLLDLTEVTKFNTQLFFGLVDNLCENGFIQDIQIVKEAFKNKKGHFGEKECVVLRKGNATK